MRAVLQESMTLQMCICGAEIAFAGASMDAVGAALSTVAGEKDL